MATKPPASTNRSTTSENHTSRLAEIGMYCMLIGGVSFLVWFILSLFVTRVPFWLAGLPFILWGIAVVCVVLDFIDSFGVNILTVFFLLIGFAILAIGLWQGFGLASKPLMNPQRGLNANDAVVTVGINPERVTPATPANLSLTIQNRSTGTLDLSTIELGTPQEFWNCFVIDYSSAEPSMVVVNQELLGLKSSGIQFEGVALSTNETLRLEVPLIGNQPGDCSGSYKVFAKAKIRGRSYAKIDDTTQLNLAVMP